MVLDAVIRVNQFYCDHEDVKRVAEKKLTASGSHTTAGGNMYNVGQMQDTFQQHMSFKIKDFSFSTLTVPNGCFTTGQALNDHSKKVDWTGVLFLGYERLTQTESLNDPPTMTLSIQGASFDMDPNTLILYRSRWTDMAKLSTFTEATSKEFRPIFQMFFFNTYNNAFLGRDHYVILDRLRSFHTVKGVLSEEKCKQLIQQSEDWVVANQNGQWDTKRHEYYPTTDIPVNKLLYYDELHQVVKDKIFPEVEKHYLFDQKCLSLQDFFIIKYDANAQHKLDWHRDVSLISFNFCLNNDFEGGGTKFADLGETIRIETGDVVLHSGKALHSGNEVTKGIRYIIVGFVKVDSQRVDYEFVRHTSKMGITDTDLYRNLLLW